MKKILEMRNRLSAHLKRINELRALETPTDEDKTSLRTELEAAQKLKTDIEAAEAEERAAAELNAFNADPVAGRDMSGNPVNPFGNGGSSESERAGTDASERGSEAQNAPPQRDTVPAQAAGRDDQVMRALTADILTRGGTAGQVRHLATPEYQRGFLEYFRRSATPGAPLPEAAQRAINSGLVADGGVLVPPQLLDRIIMRRKARRLIANAVDRDFCSSDSVKVSKFLGGTDAQNSGLTMQFPGTGGAATEDASLQNWAQISIDINRGAIVVVADRSTIEDAAIDLEGFIADTIGDMYDAAVENLIINGSGNGRPFGIVTRTSVAINGTDTVGTVNIGDPVDASLLVKLLGQIGQQYAENASFVMRRSLYFTQVASLTNANGSFQFGTSQTIVGGTEPRIETQVLGYPNLMTDFMDDAGAGNEIMIFGDLKEGYIWRDRIGLSIEPLIDPALQKADRVGWYVRCRFGGDVGAHWALKVAKNTDA